jgi:hypothetical protein
MDRMIRIAALAGFAVLTAAAAHAQGLYNNGGIFGRADPAAPPFQANNNIYTGFYTGADGLLRSGTVNAFSMNLGSGVSIGLFSVSNAPGVALSGFGGNGFVRNFPGSVPTDLISRPYFDSATSPNVAGQMSLGLGGGLSMNVFGGASRQPDSGLYFGPGSAFENRTFTTVGTGFSFNFGRGGTLSLTGSVSSGPRAYGYGFP